MLGNWDSFGNLPPGIHEPEDWSEFASRFGFNLTRRLLLEGLKDALRLLRDAGCQVVYINGSFSTAKELPDDFDVCWEGKGVDLEQLDPIFFQLDHPRTAQKIRFHGELFPASNLATMRETFLEFFQHDRNGRPKGIVKLDLRKIHGSDLEPTSVPDHEIMGS